MRSVGHPFMESRVEKNRSNLLWLPGEGSSIKTGPNRSSAR
ncbi:hypothetical protein LINGRAHAP2_LOCUS31677 [Linum grandiflorum]